jgi:hypothetical protein
MCSRALMIRDVTREHAPQVRLAEDDVRLMTAHAQHLEIDR